MFSEKAQVHKQQSLALGTLLAICKGHQAVWILKVVASIRNLVIPCASLRRTWTEILFFLSISGDPREIHYFSILCLTVLFICLTVWILLRKLIYVGVCNGCLQRTANQNEEKHPESSSKHAGVVLFSTLWVTQKWYSSLRNISRERHYGPAGECKCPMIHHKEITFPLFAHTGTLAVCLYTLNMIILENSVYSMSSLILQWTYSLGQRLFWKNYMFPYGSGNQENISI